RGMGRQVSETSYLRPSIFDPRILAQTWNLQTLSNDTALPKTWRSPCRVMFLIHVDLDPVLVKKGMSARAMTHEVLWHGDTEATTDLLYQTCIELRFDGAAIGADRGWDVFEVQGLELQSSIETIAGFQLQLLFSYLPWPLILNA